MSRKARVLWLKAHAILIVIAALLQMTSESFTDTKEWLLILLARILLTGVVALVVTIAAAIAIFRGFSHQ